MSARHGVKVLEPGINAARIRYKCSKEDINAGERVLCVLQDIQGELKISDQGRFHGKKLNGGDKAVICALLIGL